MGPEFIDNKFATWRVKHTDVQADSAIPALRPVCFPAHHLRRTTSQCPQCYTGQGRAKIRDGAAAEISLFLGAARWVNPLIKCSVGRVGKRWSLGCLWRSR